MRVDRPDQSVRPVTAAELPQLAALCRDHAQYERAEPPGMDLPDRLHKALFAPAGRLWCLVAPSGARLVGYASYSLEFATWRGAEHLHLDCLFVREPYRGQRWGRRLLDAATAHARELGVHEVQWQTPAWNTEAIRFYDRLGAAGKPKIRFSLPVSPAPHTQGETCGRRPTDPTDAR